jgi:hypothetical protein
VALKDPLYVVPLCTSVLLTAVISRSNVFNQLVSHQHTQHTQPYDISHCPRPRKGKGNAPEEISIQSQCATWNKCIGKVRYSYVVLNL